MPNTHCLPTGSLATGEIPVPQFPGGATINRPAGLVRGIVVIMQGLQTVAVPAYPPPLVNSPGTYPAGLLPLGYLDFSTQLNTDGWVTVFAPTPGQLFSSTQALGLLNTLNNDAGHGTIYQTTILHWWDHVVNYVKSNLGNWPIVPFGVSLGGLLAYTVAINRTSSIAAYGAHISPTNLWTANAGVLNVGATGFFGSADASTTVAAGSVGTTLPISGNLSVASTTGFPSPPDTLVIIRGTGGWQIIQYTSLSGGNTFVGCTGGNSGNGPLALNDVVQHSSFTNGIDLSLTNLNALPNGFQGTVPKGWVGCETGDSFIGFADQVTLANNAIAASQPVTLYQVSGGQHQFSQTDVTNAMSWFTATVDPICPKAF